MQNATANRELRLLQTIGRASQPLRAPEFPDAFQLCREVTKDLAIGAVPFWVHCYELRRRHQIRHDGTNRVGLALEFSFNGMEKSAPGTGSVPFIFEPVVRAPRIAIIGAMLGIRSHDHIKEATHVCSYLGAMIPEAGVSE